MAKFSDLMLTAALTKKFTHLLPSTLFADVRQKEFSDTNATRAVNENSPSKDSPRPRNEDYGVWGGGVCPFVGVIVSFSWVSLRPDGQSLNKYLPWTIMGGGGSTRSQSRLPSGGIGRVTT